jgi:hypothetical protein
LTVIVSTLSPEQRRTISFAGGLAGAFIGPIGFWLHAAVLVNRRAGKGWLPPPPSGGWTNFLERMTTSWGGLAALGLAFIATLVLMPILVKSLERRVTEPRFLYYRRAASAGVALGLGATAIITFILFWAALLWGYFNPDPGQTAEGGLGALLFGGMVFGSITAVFVPLLFIPYILLFGIPLGLVLGYWIRRLLQQGFPVS